jgi:hypothetical protein
MVGHVAVRAVALSRAAHVIEPHTHGATGFKP